MQTQNRERVKWCSFLLLDINSVPSVVLIYAERRYRVPEGYSLKAIFEN